MPDCFCVSVNLSPSVYLSQFQLLSVILCHLVSVSIFHAICLSHSVSVSLSHSVYLQHVSVRLFLSLCPCQFVPSALSLSVCPKCPLPSPPRLSPSSIALIAIAIAIAMLGLLWLVLRVPNAFHEKKLSHGYNGFRQ